MQGENMAGLAKVAREKTWNEKTDSERIDLLRHELRATNALLQAVHKEFQKLAHHAHATDGEIVIPYHGGNSVIGGQVGYRYDPLE